MAGFAKILRELEKQRKAAEGEVDRVVRAIVALGKLAGKRRRGRRPGRPRKRRMSAATRRKMAAAARRRWAKIKARKGSKQASPAA